MKDHRDRIITVLIVATLIFSLFTIYAYSAKIPEMKLSARSAVLYDLYNERFVFEKNENERLPMASTTKIMTAIVTVENTQLDREVTVDDRAIGIEGSSIYLTKGETLTVEALLYALMLRSANDAAAALAYEISDSIEDFALLMNDKARSLGLSDTNFDNPHGLDSENHYTTAHNLAIICAHAMKIPKLVEICSTPKKEIVSSTQKRLLLNHNKLLSMYEGCIGIKTGYTKKSGRSLASAATKGERTYICVTINAPDDWNDHKKLYNYAFSNPYA